MISVSQGSGDKIASRGQTVFRGMREAFGVLQVGQTARTLGVRPNIDIPVDSNGLVHPKTGGMSVAPGSPTNLPRHRRPTEFGGTGKDPVWGIAVGNLGPDLSYTPDASPNPTHGIIEPNRSMSFDEYQDALQSTARNWVRHD